MNQFLCDVPCILELGKRLQCILVTSLIHAGVGALVLPATSLSIRKNQSQVFVLNSSSQETQGSIWEGRGEHCSQYAYLRLLLQTYNVTMCEVGLVDSLWARFNEMLLLKFKKVKGYAHLQYLHFQEFVCISDRQSILSVGFSHNQLYLST